MAIEIDSLNTTQVQVKIRYPEHDIIHATEYDLNVHKKDQNPCFVHFFTRPSGHVQKKQDSNFALQYYGFLYLHSIYIVYI